MAIGYPTVRIAPLFESERESLLGLLDGLSGEDWERPTPCEAWTIHGLCLHLLGNDLRLLARRRDGYLGTPMPTDLDDTGRAFWLDHLQSEWVHAGRRISPQMTQELLAWTLPQLVAVLDREDPAALTARVSWAGPDLVPVGLDHVRELSEYWIHRQQLLDALGRPNDIDGRILGLILDGLRWAFPHRLGIAKAPPGSAVVIDLIGPVEERWALVNTGTRWEFGKPRPSDVVTSVQLSAAQAWRLLTNNLPAEHRERIQAHGDPALVDAILMTRAIIGNPKWSTFR